MTKEHRIDQDNRSKHDPTEESDHAAALDEAAAPPAQGRDALESRGRRFAKTHRLSEREREILLLLVAGARQKEIAGTLGCAHSSVRTHVRRMSAKLGCTGTTELLLKFFT